MVKSATLALAFAATAVVASAPDTFAAVQTWTGTDCATDCNFSNTLNWQSGVVPVNGDSVVMSNVGLPTNDITNLSLVGLTLNGALLTLNANMIINGTIDSGSASTTMRVTPTGDLVLGGDTLVRSTSSMQIAESGGAGGQVMLNSFDLTYDTTGSTGDSYVRAPITGAGSVAFDGDQRMFIDSINTYSGTTTIFTDRLIVNSVSTNPFGSSAVTIPAAGSVEFNGHTGLNLANTFTIEGTASTDPNVIIGITPLRFLGTSYALSGIVLNGNSRFSNPMDAAVDLAGITANSFCIMYSGDNFSNGPTACSLDGLAAGGSGAVSDEAVAAPNTALRILSANPVIVAILGVLSLAALALTARNVAAKK